MQPIKTLGEALRIARERRGLSQLEVAEYLKVSRAAVGQWERGVNEPSTKNLIQICELLRIDVAAATGGLVRLAEYPSAISGELDADTRSMRVEDRRPSTMHQSFTAKDGTIAHPDKNVPLIHVSPVHGLSISAEGQPTLYPDLIVGREIIDLCPRPPGLPYTKNVQAFYIPNQSNSPRFQSGELAFFHADRIGRDQDFVLVKFSHETSEKDLPGYYGIIGYIYSQSMDRMVIKQLNPKRDHEIAVNDVESINRIFYVHELFGK